MFTRTPLTRFHLKPHDGRHRDFPEEASLSFHQDAGELVRRVFSQFFQEGGALPVEFAQHPFRLLAVQLVCSSNRVHLVLSCFCRAHSAKEYDALAEPMADRRGKPRVLFAGEHTTKYHPSTVHGAWLTGLREATRLDFHARAGWHRKGKRDDDFSPDIMYETSVLFDPTRITSRSRKSVRRSPGKVRVRPSKQSDGTECRRSPRISMGSRRTKWQAQPSRRAGEDCKRQKYDEHGAKRVPK